MRLISRITVRFAKAILNRSRLPASIFGFIYLRSKSLEQLSSEKYSLQITTVLPTVAVFDSFPANIATRGELPTKLVFGRSFADIPQRTVRAAMVVRLSNCKFVTYYDRWNNVFPLVLDGEDSILPMRHIEVNGGGGFNAFHGHSRVLRKSASSRIPRAAWIIENWSTNYYHWLVYHLPKLLLLREYFPEYSIILPRKGNLQSFILESLMILGYSSNQLLKPSTELVFVDDLAFVDIDRHDSRLLRNLAILFTKDNKQNSRKYIYICRTKALWRHVVNENEIFEFLKTVGFEIIAAEDLSFSEQIGLMQNTILLVSPHGAGLTNMLFLHEKSIVVELVNPEFPNSDYYSLAVSLGHTYYFFNAEDIPDNRPSAFHDMRVPLGYFKKLIYNVIGALSSR